MNANIFVGYTEAGTELGCAMHKKLKESGLRPKKWRSAFHVGKSIFSEVLNKPYEYDFGVFVFSENDFKNAGESVFLASNLVFELGLFIGVKGKTRAFPVWPKGCELPPDLQGVIHPRFDPTVRDPSEALENACRQIIDQIKDPPCESYYFIMNKASGRCLDVKDWVRRSGNPIIQWRYHGGTNQIWSIERHRGRWFKIISGHSGLCMQVKDESDKDEAPIEQGKFRRLRHQQWSLTRGPERAYIIKNRHSRKVLAIGKNGEDLVVQRAWVHADDKLWWISQEARIDVGALAIPQGAR